VTDASEWQRLGKILAVEGMTDSGLPRQHIKSFDGVYERVRTRHEILGFGRPDYRPGRERPIETDGLPEIKTTNIKTGKRTRDIELVQLALGKKTGLRNADRAKWDGLTMTAYANWQRAIGYTGTDVTGMPDQSSLARLGRETGYFRVT
jgi:hypothetical protein